MAELPSIRSVMPWWYVGAVAVSFAVVLVLAETANLFMVAPLWATLIGTTVRDRRTGSESRNRRAEIRVTLVLTPLFLGIAALISQVWPFPRGPVDARVLIGGAVALAVGGAIFLVLRLQAARRT
jgi:hypothetical protein